MGRVTLTRTMDPELESRLNQYLRELREKAPDMFKLFVAIIKYDETKMSLGQWCQDFQRYRIYEQLGFEDLGDFLRGAAGLSKNDPQFDKKYNKLRNGWLNVIRSYQRGKGGDRIKLAS